MKKLLLLCLILLTCLPSFGGGFNFWPESKEVECSIILLSEPVEAGKLFPDFTLIFTNKSRKEVRLLDSFYPSKTLKPDIFLEIWDGEAREMAYYWARYRVERSVENTKFTVLKPGIPFQVTIRNFAEHIIYLHPLEKGKKYLMKVTYRDGYGTPGRSVGYVARKEFVAK
ncbi:hypothetical protein ABGM91_01415 [Akkermansia muciniphila]|uniref:hypothetical protein n=1 Tax=Akkermansia muciniphila TaxID=239935 RepID=UPI0033A27E68